MDSEQFVDLILEFKPKGDLLVKCLFSFLVVFIQNLLFVIEIDVFGLESLNLFKDLHIPILVELVVLLNDVLSLCDFCPELIDFGDLLPFNHPHESLKLALSAVLQQIRENLPNIFLRLNSAVDQLPEAVVEADAVYE